MKPKDYEYCILYSLVVTFVVTVLLVGGVLFITNNKLNYVNERADESLRQFYSRLHEDAPAVMYNNYNGLGENKVKGLSMGVINPHKISSDSYSEVEIKVRCDNIECPELRGTTTPVVGYPVDLELSCTEKDLVKNCTYIVSKSDSILNNNFLRINSEVYDPTLEVVNELEVIGKDAVGFMEAYIETLSIDYSLSEKLTGVVETVTTGLFRFTMKLGNELSFLLSAIPSYDTEYKSITLNKQSGVSFYDGSTTIDAHIILMEKEVSNLLGEYNTRQRNRQYGQLVGLFNYGCSGFVSIIATQIISQASIVHESSEMVAKETNTLSEGFNELYDNLKINESKESRAIRLRILHDYLSMRLGKKVNKQQYENMIIDYDFEQGAQGWNSEPGWEIINESTNNFLRGEGHHWISEDRTTCTDFTFRSMVKLYKGSMHVVLRSNDEGRYFIGLHDNTISLSKQFNKWNDFTHPVSTEASFNLEDWYNLEIKAVGDNILIYLNQELKINYTDPEPILYGSVAYETLDDSIWYVDDVRIDGVCYRELR